MKIPKTIRVKVFLDNGYNFIFPTSLRSRDEYASIAEHKCKLFYPSRKIKKVKDLGLSRPYLVRTTTGIARVYFCLDREKKLQFKAWKKLLGIVSIKKMTYKQLNKKHKFRLKQLNEGHKFKLKRRQLTVRKEN